MPLESAVIVKFSFATGSGESGFPPCALIIFRHTSIAEPSLSALAGSLPLMPTSSNISRAKITVNSTTSSGPPPDKTSSDSRTSSALPAVRPSGISIAVTSAKVLTPASLPRPTIVCANSRALSGSLINAPAPVFTSSTNALVPSAIFLLIIDDAMSGIASTVAVTSRSA